MSKKEILENKESISVQNESVNQDTSVSGEKKFRFLKIDDSPQEVEVNEQIAQEKLEEMISSQKPQKKKKSAIINTILLLINIIFMVIIVRGLISSIGDQNFFDYAKKQGNRLWWLLGGVGCYIVYICAQMLMFHALIKKTTGESKWKLAYDVGLTGKYYDNVTPFAVGGQPMQIVTLSKNGISPGVSTSLPLIKMIINSMVSSLLALAFFVFGLPRIPMVGGLYDFLLVILEILGIIGLVITLLGVLFMILISAGGLFTRSLVSGLVKIGYKLKIVKNYRASLKKWLSQVSEYRSSMAYLAKNKILLLKMIVFSIIETLSYACISFFVVMAFAETIEISVPMLFFTCIVKYYICAMAGSYIPLPGATGLMEIAFISLYSMYVGDAIVWALLAWRILSYYLILVHGFIHEVSSIIKGMSKQKKLKKEGEI